MPPRPPSPETSTGSGPRRPTPTAPPLRGAGRLILSEETRDRGGCAPARPRRQTSAAADQSPSDPSSPTLPSAQRARPAAATSRGGRTRTALILEHGLRLPELEPLLELGRPKMWFAVPGMYGGFCYRLEHGLRLPELEPLLELGRPKMWFAVPGMYGGFSYRGAAAAQLGPNVAALVVELHTELGMPLEKVVRVLRTQFGLHVTKGGLVRLLHRTADAAAPAYAALREQVVSESWCRVVGGSGQRHAITPAGSQLVEEGFV